jgi:hypothetical protein
MNLKAIVSAATFSLVSITGVAQEYNLGIHLNPTLTIPIIDGASTYDKEIGRRARIGYNVGANINYKNGPVSLETGVNIVSKAVQFRQHIISTYTGGASYYYTRFTGTGFEFPLLVGYKAFHNSGKNPYDFYVQGGGSYEIFTNDGTAGGSRLYGDGAMSINTGVPGPPPDRKHTWFNAIVGFKINTIVKKLGLIDYGMTYHLPFDYAGPYHTAAEVTLPNGSNRYVGTFRPLMSYLDVKLCYYFLNFDKSFSRMKYRSMG